MSIEEALEQAVRKAVEPLRTELQRVTAALNAVQRSIPAQLVRLKVAAKHMGVSLKTARRRVDAGEWPSRKDGRNILVDLSDLRPVSDEEATRVAIQLRAVTGGKSGKD